MPVRSYYHVYAAGAWAIPVREHVVTLAVSGLRAPMVIGLVGTVGARWQAKQAIGRLLRESGLPAPERWAEADDGWEQVTLAEIHCDVHQVPGEFAVLYAHTKGASDPSPLNAAWRRSMTWHVVAGWERCAGLLASGHDTAGCHWVTAPHDPATSFYAGNFWMARASYLRGLPPPETASRWPAETWVSSKSSPQAADLLPGWPQFELPAR